MVVVFKQFRERILDLAMQGKLCHMPEPEIPVHKQTQGDLDFAPLVEPDEASDNGEFELPYGWGWVRVGDLGEWQSGHTPKRDDPSMWQDGSVNWVKVSDLHDAEIFATEEKVTERALLVPNIRKYLRVFPVGSVVIAVTGGSIGKVGILGVACATNQSCYVCTVNPRLATNWFVLYALKWLRPQLLNIAEGTITLQLSKTKLCRAKIPLPPLEEQQRIAEKLRAIDAQLDKLEQAYAQLSGPLYDQFREVVLREALCGKLVRREESDGIAPQLDLESQPDPVPFILPSTWKWVQASQVGSWRYGRTPSSKEAAFWEGGTISFLRAGELEDQLVAHTKDKVTELASRVKHGRAWMPIFPEGTVVLGTCGITIGRLGVLAMPCAVNESCLACVVNAEIINSWYLFYALLAQKQELLLKAQGITNLSHINKIDVLRLWIPLPPLAEQQRIAERVHELFSEAEKLLSLKSFESLNDLIGATLEA